MRLTYCVSYMACLMACCDVTFAADQISVQKEVAARGMDFGLAFGELIYFASSKSKLPPASYRGDNSATALEAMRVNYTNQYAVQRASVKLLDSSLNLALGAGVVMTGGIPAILAGSSLGYVKTKATGLLTEEIDRNAKIFLATNLTKFNKDNGNDYESLRASGNIDVIKKSIDSTGLLSDFSAGFAGDPVAAETLRTAIVKNILSTQKATLDKLAVTSADSANAELKLTKVSKDLRLYSEKIDKAVNELKATTTDLADAMSQSQRAIDDLTINTAKNSNDLKVVGEILYSQSAPAQKIALLNAGFYGELESDNKKNLIVELQGEIKKELFVQKVQNVIGTINGISTIAKNLNINIAPEVDQAISFGNVASQALTAYVSGNPLGAVVAVSGLLGGGLNDPSSANQAALLSYLSKEFANINKKLDDIYALQVTTLNAIEKLSEDIAKLQYQMHLRFDALSYEVETLQISTRALLFSGINHCTVLRDQWRQQVPSLRSNVVPSLAELLTIAPLSSYAEVELCLTSLKSLFALATTRYSDFSQNPLALRIIGIAPNLNSTSPSNSEVADYRSSVQVFEDENFRPSYHLAIELNADDDISSAARLWSFSTPARSVPSLKSKIDLMKKYGKTCVSGTLQNKPTLDMLCSMKQDSTVDLGQLAPISNTSSENEANKRAQRLMRNGLIQEPLSDLVELALLFSAVAETQDPATAKRLTSIPAILGKKRLPQGRYLLANALKTTTLATAQGGMLYGDFTAFAIYKILWSSEKARFLTLDEISEQNAMKDDRARALKLLSKNPYLKKNVLMFALSESIGQQTSGETIAYRFALSEHLKTGEGKQLNLFFKNEIAFSLAVDPNCVGVCTARPVAAIGNIFCSLPTWADFARRKLDYPPVVTSIEVMSDALARRLVSYDLAIATKVTSKVSLSDQAIILTTFGEQKANK